MHQSPSVTITSLGPNMVK